MTAAAITGPAKVRAGLIDSSDTLEPLLIKLSLKTK